MPGRSRSKNGVASLAYAAGLFFNGERLNDRVKPTAAPAKVAGRERCHEEATRTAPVPAEPHGPRRCGGPEHSAGLSDAPVPSRAVVGSL